MRTVRVFAVIVLVSLLMISCATERRVLSLAEATAIAGDKPKRVIVAGIYSFHSEGDALVEQVGWFSRNDILLYGKGPYRLLRTPEEIAGIPPSAREKMKALSLLHGKSVTVAGTLQRGTNPWGNIRDCVFLVVEKVEETDREGRLLTPAVPNRTN